MSLFFKTETFTIARLFLSQLPRKSPDSSHYRGFFWVVVPTGTVGYKFIISRPTGTVGITEILPRCIYRTIGSFLPSPAA